MKKIFTAGAGIAGLAASVKLAGAGLQVILAEKRSFPGGRAYSVYDKKTGESIDNGQHIFAGAYDNFFEMLRELKTDNYLAFQKHLKVKFYEKNAGSYTLDSSHLPGKAGMAAALFNLKKVSFKSKSAALAFFLKILLGYIKNSNLTAEELLKRENQGTDILQRFWEPLVIAVCNGAPDKISSNLLIKVLKEAFFSDTERASLVFPQTSLSNLLQPAAEYLRSRNGIVLFGKSLEAFSMRENEVLAAILNDGTEIKADYYISALKPERLLPALPERIQQEFSHLQRIRYSPIISVYLWFDREFSDDDFAGFIGSPLQWIFNRRKLINKSSGREEKYPGHYTITISAADELMEKTSKEILEMCIDELNDFFPEMSKAKLLEWKVIKDKKATPLIDPVTDAARPLQKTFINNLALAGDWTDTGLPATIEGAALSGVKAADAALEFLRISGRK